MLYFDRITESHFGSIRQQIWSFLHFPLHVVLVLVLQGISLLIIWRQAVESLHDLDAKWLPAIDFLDTDNYNTALPQTPDAGLFAAQMDRVSDTYSTGRAFADYMNDTVQQTVYKYIPKGVDASKELKTIDTAYHSMRQGLDNFLASDQTNSTAEEQLWNGFNAMTSATYKTLFDTFSVTIAKRKLKKTEDGGGPDLMKTSQQYYHVFDLIMGYTFVAVSFLILSQT